eukprot:Pgem_evm1s4752
MTYTDNSEVEPLYEVFNESLFGIKQNISCVPPKPPSLPIRKTKLSTKCNKNNISSSLSVDLEESKDFVNNGKKVKESKSPLTRMTIKIFKGFGKSNDNLKSISTSPDNNVTLTSKTSVHNSDPKSKNIKSKKHNSKKNKVSPSKSTSVTFGHVVDGNEKNENSMETVSKSMNSLNNNRRAINGHRRKYNRYTQSGEMLNHSNNNMNRN